MYISKRCIFNRTLINIGYIYYLLNFMKSNKKRKYVIESLSYLKIIKYIKISILIYNNQINNNIYLFDKISFCKIKDSFDFYISLDAYNINYKKYNNGIKLHLIKIASWWLFNKNKNKNNFDSYLIRIYYSYIRNFYFYFNIIKPII